MTLAAKKQPIDQVLGAVARGISKTDLDSAKCSLKELTSQKNAYTNAHIDDQKQRWNMITYKKGQKSSL